MATVVDSGSQACTVTTEHVLSTYTTAGTLVFVADFNASAGGSTPDVFEVRYYDKARSGDTERQAEIFSLQGVQTTPLVHFKPIVSPHHLKVTLKQTQGTSRTILWSLRSTA